MRRAWSLSSALGLLVMVAAGTWGWLTRSVNESGASTSALVALGGAAVMVIGVVGRGDGARSIAKARRGLGGFGLVIAPVSAALGLLQLGTDPGAAVGFLIVTLVALVLWAQAMALQAGLSLRVAISWLTLAIGFAAVVFPIAGVVAALISRLGGGSQAASAVGAGAATVIVAGVLRVWASNRSDRQAVPGAVRRAMFGHALPGDLDTLARGPGHILRRRPPSATDVTARAARIAELDARFGSGTVGDRVDDGDGLS